MGERSMLVSEMYKKKKKMKGVQWIRVFRYMPVFKISCSLDHALRCHREFTVFTLCWWF